MKRKSFIRRFLLAAAGLVLFAALPLAAQTSEPSSGPHPHGHPRGGPPTSLHSLGYMLDASRSRPGDESDQQSAGPVLLDATHLGSPIELTRAWRVGVSSDEGASPDFDDSKWAVRDAAESIADVNDTPDSGEDEDKAGRKRGPRDFVWLRMHVRLAPGHGPLALLIEVPVKLSTSMGSGASSSDADVFANGHEIVPDGPHPMTPELYQPISRVYLLNVPADETNLTLAIRTLHIPFGWKAYTRFFATRTLILGSPDSVGRSRELWRNRSVFEWIPRLVNSVLLVVQAIFLFLLFFTQRGHREYLWLALFCLAQAPICFIDLAGSFAYIETMRYAAMFMELIAISSYLYFEFLVAFLGLGKLWAGKWKRWIIYLLRFTAPIMIGVGPTLLMAGHSWWADVLLAVVYTGTVIWFIGWLIFCFTVLITATLRRNYEAGLLLIPLVLSFVGLLEPIFTSGMMSSEGHPYKSPLTIYAGPVPIHFASIADFVGLIAIALIIFVRFLRIHRDQERASSELAAARSVQELMIPHEQVKTPGFDVESVYTPAAEVGGDFFHLASTPDGGLLVVIGDVAGKGLKAAMSVSMLMGVLRSADARNPAKILEAMNKALVGSESFTTCQAAWFGPSGELVIANAGHLPPYLNSQELELPGGLPIGVVPSVTYEEVRLFLHPGDRVLFMSDGVVEARQPSGELFGFDRIHNLSNQSAFYIADAAKEFGQEDDITVLTVRRLAPAAVAA